MSTLQEKLDELIQEESAVKPVDKKSDKWKASMKMAQNSLKDGSKEELEKLAMKFYNANKDKDDDFDN